MFHSASCSTISITRGIILLSVPFLKSTEVLSKIDAENVSNSPSIDGLILTI